MTHVFNSVFAILLGFFSVMAVPVMAAGTSDGSSAASTTQPTYEQAKATVDAGKFKEALPMLVALTKTDPKNADAWNLLGFTYRKLGQMDDSSTAYLKVLAINPNHLGALEYQGELFITTGKIKEAKANLAKLKGLCGNCEQSKDLEKALKTAGA
jgi:Flp pilus assembly protein TadD